MRLGRDGIAGLIGLAVSLALLPFAFGLPQLPIVPIGPGFYPKIILSFLAVMCAVLIGQDVAAQRRTAGARVPEPETEAGPSPRYGPRYALVLAAFLVTGAYVAVLPQLGFRIATVLFVAAFQLVLERPRTAWQWLVLALIAFGTTAVTYVLFEQYLSVLLPRGRWTDW